MAPALGGSQTAWTQGPHVRFKPHLENASVQSLFGSVIQLVNRPSERGARTAAAGLVPCFTGMATGREEATRRVHSSQNKPVYPEAKCSGSDVHARCLGIKLCKVYGGRDANNFPQVHLNGYPGSASLNPWHRVLSRATPWLEGHRVYSPGPGYICSRASTTRPGPKASQKH